MYDRSPFYFLIKAYETNIEQPHNIMIQFISKKININNTIINNLRLNLLIFLWPFISDNMPIKDNNTLIEITSQ